MNLGDVTKRGLAALLTIFVNAFAVLLIYWILHPVAGLTSAIFHTIILIVALYHNNNIRDCFTEKASFSHAYWACRNGFA